MHVFLLGGTGFIGRHLCQHLTAKGHTLTVLSRSGRMSPQMDGVRVLKGDPLYPGPWQEEAAGCQAIINLVGRNIMARWTETVKTEILETRVQSTRLAVQAVETATGAKPVFINANAVGYYPFSDSEIFDESGPAGDHFLARVCVAWQEAAQQAASSGARVVVTRFAPVLAAQGGMLETILPVFTKGTGGRIGSGKQPFPWVHIQDLVRALEWALQTPSVHGPVNVCAPEVITNARFTKALGRALNRPAVLPVPEFVLRLRFGEMASMLGKGQAVRPRVLEDHGFVFSYPTIEAALTAIVSEK